MCESLAGQFVVETYFLEPDLFDTYIAFDPSLWWNDRELVDSASARLERTSSTPRALYLANSSEEELAQLTERLANAIALHASGGLTVHLQSMSDETHASIYHPAALVALRRMFKPEPGGD